MTDKYTLIFEDKNGNSETIEIQHILLVFHTIKLNLRRLKKDALQITLIKNNSTYLSKPKNTNVLIQMMLDYYKFIDDKLALIRTPKKDEVIVFNTGNSDWFDTNILEALKRPTDKTTKIFVLKKKDLIEVSKKHTSLGIYKLSNINPKKDPKHRIIFEVSLTEDDEYIFKHTEMSNTDILAIMEKIYNMLIAKQQNINNKQ